MSKQIPITMVATLATFALSAPLAAQDQSTISASVLDEALTVDASGARATLQAALGSAQGLEAAGRLGLSAEDLAARVATLDDATVQRLSDRLLVGGANIVISTTAIIIALLIIILLTS